MNPTLERLKPYPFERLAELTRGIVPPAGLSPIRLTIGEPRHAPPGFVLDRLREALGGVAVYPLTAGQPALRAACARWCGFMVRMPTCTRRLACPASMMPLAAPVTTSHLCTAMARPKSTACR